MGGKRDQRYESRVAAGSAFGASALSVATIVKLTRNALKLPVLVCISLVWRRRLQRPDENLRTIVLRAVPLFVVGFLALATARSIGFIANDIAGVLNEVSRALIPAALAAIGLSTPLNDLRGTGWRPLGLGLAVAACIGVMSLVILLLTGLAMVD